MFWWQIQRFTALILFIKWVQCHIFKHQQPKIKYFLLDTMSIHKLVSLWFSQLLLVVLVLDCTYAHSLRLGFYQHTCPNAEDIIAKTTHKYISRAPPLAAAILRMHFHDCFVRVCCWYKFFSLIFVLGHLLTMSYGCFPLTQWPRLHNQTVNPCRSRSLVVHTHVYTYIV